MGTTLRGKYRLDRLLGVGGMAAVYAGTHRNGLAVAVKVLHPWAAAEPTIVDRFVREGYIANAIDHPGAVRVLDDDVTEDGAVYLVMELLDGRALADVAAHGPTFPLDAALDAADQLLDVLAAAHGKQIVHRDLKPENLFVTQSGQLKLLDLGIARMRGITGKSVATRSGSLMGTPGVMPPEQVLGEQEKIDARPISGRSERRSSRCSPVRSSTRPRRPSRRCCVPRRRRFPPSPASPRTCPPPSPP